MRYFREAYVYINEAIEKIPKMQTWATKRHRKLTKYESWTVAEQDKYKREEAALYNLAKLFDSEEQDDA